MALRAAAIVPHLLLAHLRATPGHARGLNDARLVCVRHVCCCCCCRHRALELGAADGPHPSARRQQQHDHTSRPSGRQRARVCVHRRQAPRCEEARCAVCTPAARQQDTPRSSRRLGCACERWGRCAASCAQGAAARLMCVRVRLSELKTRLDDDGCIAFCFVTEQVLQLVGHAVLLPGLAGVDGRCESCEDSP